MHHSWERGRKPKRERLQRRAFLQLADVPIAVALPEVASFADEPYPSREVHIIVPYAAGAGTDAVTRLVARQLASSLGRSVVVENRAGANGNLGTNIVAKARPDGYVLGTATPGPVAVGKSLYPNLPYDPALDLAPVALFNQSPVVALAGPRLAVSSAAELIARAKAEPGTLNAAIAANGSINHLVTELFKFEAGADLKNIPYGSGAQAVTDTIGGHVDLIFISLSSVVGAITGGELRPLAIAAPVRSRLIPAVPTMAEIGLPAVLGSQWNGLVAPAATPAAIVSWLNAAVRDALVLPEVTSFFTEQGMEPAGGTQESFAAFLRDETARWASVVKRAQVKVE